jgi:hypothetical protein
MQPMYYIGLDVHKRKISYCVKDSSGKLHSEGSIPATHFDLDRWMKTHQELAKGPAHPFYDRANELLEAEQFDEFAEKECAKLELHCVAGKRLRTMLPCETSQRHGRGGVHRGPGAAKKKR